VVPVAFVLASRQLGPDFRGEVEHILPLPPALGTGRVTQAGSLPPGSCANSTLGGWTAGGGAPGGFSDLVVAVACIDRHDLVVQGTTGTDSCPSAIFPFRLVLVERSGGVDDCIHRVESPVPTKEDS